MSQNKGGGNIQVGRNRKIHKKKVNIGDKGKEIVEGIDENSFVMQQFRVYANELDDKHDRFERIGKINRDVTIESKRIIFLLHTIDKESNPGNVMVEAINRLINMIQCQFKAIAKELENQDRFLYLKAYRSGLEEFIEAVSFYQYLEGVKMECWLDLTQAFIYLSTCNNKSESCFIDVSFTPLEYILGIADLTGELMRKCINNLATGDIASCYKACDFVRSLYKGFLGCATSISSKEINRKLYTLKQSLHKMENVCYTIKVRGSEIPKHILADVANEEYTKNYETYEAY